jgi:hypothetical protein
MSKGSEKNILAHNFHTQSVITKEGLDCFEGNLQLLENEDRRFAESVFTKHSQTECSEAAPDDKKNQPRMRVIPKEIIKAELSLT